MQLDDHVPLHSILPSALGPARAQEEGQVFEVEEVVVQLSAPQVLGPTPDFGAHLFAYVGTKLHCMQHMDDYGIRTKRSVQPPSPGTPRICRNLG